MKPLNEYFAVEIMVRDAAQLASVYALLGGVAFAAVRSPEPQRADPAPPPPPPADKPDYSEQLPPEAPAAGTDEGGEIDAHGHPWSADLHASTKGKTKDGLWRMKVGVSRPDPKPGFPVAGDTGTSGNGAASEASGSASEASASSPAATTQDEDDEFAAFRAAAARSDEKDATATAAAPARKWTDADLGALCNQAAVKLGDPAPIKELIGNYVPEGEVAHSRNIPEDRREEFAKAVESKAGIEFAG